MTDRPPDILAAFKAVLTEHEPHTWEQIGPCVYCADCQVRLYHGTIPPGHPRLSAKRMTKAMKDNQEMRERWSKD
jgi:hypothetical protein